VTVSIGVGVIVTVVIVDAEHTPPRVAVTVYIPVADGFTFRIIGFCKVEVNDAGPTHLYVTPAVASVANNRNVSRSQIIGGPGELLVATGTSGVESTTTINVDVSDVQPPNVALTEYTPEASVVAGLIDGFCSPEVNPLGPVQSYVDNEVLVAFSSSAVPEHIGPLLPIVGGYGVESITIAMVPRLRHVIPSAVRETVTV
jgi:hypothetical protein